MEVEPNRVLHTSPARLVEVENRFISRYPSARAVTEIMAMAASPLMRVFCPVRSSRMALKMVTGRTSSISSVRFMTVAIAMPPKATWESPSPIKEKRLRTRVTPRREEHRAIRMPTIRA